MTKSQELITQMINAYPQGVSYKRLALITPAYSQRFGEFAKNGIVINQVNIDGESYYYLRTHPTAIDPMRIELLQGELL